MLLKGRTFCDVNSFVIFLFSQFNSPSLTSNQPSVEDPHGFGNAAGRPPKSTRKMVKATRPAKSSSAGSATRESEEVSSQPRMKGKKRNQAGVPRDDDGSQSFLKEVESQMKTGERISEDVIQDIVKESVAKGVDLLEGVNLSKSIKEVRAEVRVYPEVPDLHELWSLNDDANKVLLCFDSSGSPADIEAARLHLRGKAKLLRDSLGKGHNKVVSECNTSALNMQAALAARKKTNQSVEEFEAYYKRERAKLMAMDEKAQKCVSEAETAHNLWTSIANERDIANQAADAFDHLAENVHSKMDIDYEKLEVFRQNQQLVKVLTIYSGKPRRMDDSTLGESTVDDPTVGSKSNTSAITSNKASDRDSMDSNASVLEKFKEGLFMDEVSLGSVTLDSRFNSSTSHQSKESSTSRQTKDSSTSRQSKDPSGLNYTDQNEVQDPPPRAEAQPTAQSQAASQEAPPEAASASQNAKEP